MGPGRIHHESGHLNRFGLGFLGLDFLDPDSLGLDFLDHDSLGLDLDSGPYLLGPVDSFYLLFGSFVRCKHR